MTNAHMENYSTQFDKLSKYVKKLKRLYKIKNISLFSVLPTFQLATSRTGTVDMVSLDINMSMVEPRCPLKRSKLETIFFSFILPRNSFSKSRNYLL